MKQQFKQSTQTKPLDTIKQLSTRRVVVQIIPKTVELAKLMKESGHSAFIELSLRSNKSLTSIIRYLNKKWSCDTNEKGSFPNKIYRLKLFPVNLHYPQGFGITNSQKITIGLLYHQLKVEVLQIEYAFDIYIERPNNRKKEINSTKRGISNQKTSLQPKQNKIFTRSCNPKRENFLLDKKKKKTKQKIKTSSQTQNSQTGFLSQKPNQKSKNINKFSNPPLVGITTRSGRILRSAKGNSKGISNINQNLNLKKVVEQKQMKNNKNKNKMINDNTNGNGDGERNENGNENGNGNENENESRITKMSISEITNKNIEKMNLQENLEGTFKNFHQFKNNEKKETENEIKKELEKKKGDKKNEEEKETEKEKKNEKERVQGLEKKKVKEKKNNKRKEESTEEIEINHQIQCGSKTQKNQKEIVIIENLPTIIKNPLSEIKLPEINSNILNQNKKQNNFEIIKDKTSKELIQTEHAQIDNKNKFFQEKTVQRRKRNKLQSTLPTRRSSRIRDLQQKNNQSNDPFKKNNFNQNKPKLKRYLIIGKKKRYKIQNKQNHNQNINQNFNFHKNINRKRKINNKNFINTKIKPFQMDQRFNFKNNEDNSLNHENENLTNLNDFNLEIKIDKEHPLANFFGRLQNPEKFLTKQDNNTNIENNYNQSNIGGYQWKSDIPNINKPQITESMRAKTFIIPSEEISQDGFKIRKNEKLISLNSNDNFIKIEQENSIDSFSRLRFEDSFQFIPSQNLESSTTTTTTATTTIIPSSLSKKKNQTKKTKKSNESPKVTTLTETASSSTTTPTTRTKSPPPQQQPPPTQKLVPNNSPPFLEKHSDFRGISDFTFNLSSSRQFTPNRQSSENISVENTNAQIFFDQLDELEMNAGFEDEIDYNDVLYSGVYIGRIDPNENLNDNSLLNTPKFKTSHFEQKNSNDDKSLSNIKKFLETFDKDILPSSPPSSPSIFGDYN
ncbi:c-type lectin [Anaeramoeba flamelloides]|uniref:C-type lectin n=1 Tax=Anaeramoeba flamelloides TaxID=1746091 RepID=A0ABQ8YBV0_9EUKA|nr:c-type lectin [Anaeramoeba flamelloides]